MIFFQHICWHTFIGRSSLTRSQQLISLSWNLLTNKSRFSPRSLVRLNSTKQNFSCKRTYCWKGILGSQSWTALDYRLTYQVYADLVRELENCLKQSSASWASKAIESRKRTLSLCCLSDHQIVQTYALYIPKGIAWQPPQPNKKAWDLKKLRSRRTFPSLSGACARL